ncbi:FGGY family carbohydrate kinase [Tessaracoccus sp. G1721]
MAILALDQGTSGSKAIVVDEDGVRAVVEKPIHPSYLGDGGVEQDPLELLDSIIEVGRQAIEQANAPIEAVCLANQGESILAWDPETGRPLTPILVWQDSRAASICAELSMHADEVHELTALVLDPYFTAPKMAWLRKNLTTEGVVTTTDTWIVHRLTGEFVTDTSTASRSLLLNVDTLQWEPRLLEIFGLGDEKLPRLVASDEIVGTTSVFGPQVPVTGLIVDQQAALLAQSCLTPGSAKCTYGTGAFLLANIGARPVRFDNGLTTSVAWTLRGATTYCVDGQVYTAASGVRWMQRLGLFDTPDQMDSIAAPSSEGVFCAPSLAGLAAPWWQPNATGFVSGLKLSTGKPHIIRAFLEGIAAQIAELSDLVFGSIDADLVAMRADGGLTRSSVLMQAQADLLRVPVEIYPSAHATPMGAAAAARMALNPRLTLAEAPFPWKASATYQPQMPDNDAERFRKHWRASVDAQLALDQAWAASNAPE